MARPGPGRVLARDPGLPQNLDQVPEAAAALGREVAQIKFYFPLRFCFFYFSLFVVVIKGGN